MPRIENRIHFDQKADATFLLSNVGGGKRTFSRITHAEMDRVGANVQVIEPSDGNWLTSNTWAAMNAMYGRAGRPGRFQDWVGTDRAKTTLSLKDRVLLGLANREVLAAAKESDVPLVTFHGMLGRGADRILIDADEVPEPKGIDARTTLLVPTNSAKDRAHAIRQSKAIEVVGFLVPEQLLHPERPNQIIDHFSEGKPTPDNPLRIAYMMTGQTAHMDALQDDVLSDPTVASWIQEDRIKLDVYMWTDEKKAEQVHQFASSMGLPSITTNQYAANREYGVQVYWNGDPNTAVDDSFAMLQDAHIMITPPAERTPFVATTYPISLPPVKGNAKMEGNYQWLTENGIAGPAAGTHNLGETLLSLFSDEGTQVRRHFERAQTVFEDGKLLQGAENSVKIILG